MSALTTEKTLAPESKAICDARRKLESNLRRQNELMTPEALKETIKKIHDSIHRNNGDRVLVKRSSMGLFDQNKEAAQTSKKVQELAAQLRKTLSQTPPVA